MEKIVRFLLFILGAGDFTQARRQPERRFAVGVSCAEKTNTGSAYKRPAMLPRNHSP
jgi:hypothetical protein